MAQIGQGLDRRPEHENAKRQFDEAKEVLETLSHMQKDIDRTPDDKKQEKTRAMQHYIQSKLGASKDTVFTEGHLHQLIGDRILLVADHCTNPQDVIDYVQAKGIQLPPTTQESAPKTPQERAYAAVVSRNKEALKTVTEEYQATMKTDLSKARKKVKETQKEAKNATDKRWNERTSPNTSTHQTSESTAARSPSA